MENKDISQIALEKIKESGIKPISKSVFNTKKIFFWFLVGFSVVVGAISFSVTLFILCNNDWYLYGRYGLGFIFKTLPYFWVVCLLILALLGEFYYRKTPLGYRHRMVTTIAFYIVATVVFGSILHMIGMSEKVEKSLFENVSVYRGVMFDKNDVWFHPEEGLLSGEIISVGRDTVELIDFNGNIWAINMKNTLVSKRAKIEVGEIIKIIGDNDKDDIFMANEIRPWIGGRINQNCCTVR